MKCLRLICLFFILINVASISIAKTCEECPQYGGCITIIKDICNSCTCPIYCIDDQWYRILTCACTAIDCDQDSVLIDNPYR